MFATRPIPKDTFIVEYKGQKISAAESDRREARYLKRGRIWCFMINARQARDAAYGGNTGRYVNHACRPNCYTEVIGHHIWLFASRDIREGEEHMAHTAGESIPLVQVGENLRGLVALLREF